MLYITLATPGDLSSFITRQPADRPKITQLL
jgi:hypothetical protein